MLAASATWWAVIAAVVVFIVYTIVFNVRGRKRERQISSERGHQIASDFAALFNTAIEQQVARELFPSLQSLTFSHEFSFRPTGGFQELELDQTGTIHRLGIDDEDLADGVVQVFKRLGIPKTDIDWQPFQSVSTVGDLVSAIATVIVAHNRVPGR